MRVVAVLLVCVALTSGCSDPPPEALATSTSTVPPPSAPIPSEPTPVGFDVEGLVSAIEVDMSGDGVLGSVTIDGTVVLITEATVVETCGPDDGGEVIAFAQAEALLNEVTSLVGRATIVAGPGGPSPRTARATSVFLGSCG